MYYETIIETDSSMYRIPNCEVNPIEYNPEKDEAIPVRLTHGGEEVDVMVTSVEVDVDRERILRRGMPSRHMVRGETYTIRLANEDLQPNEIISK